MNNILFSKEECEYIKSFWNESLAEDGSKPGKVYLDDGNTISFKRDAILLYLDLENNELINFVLSKLSNIGIKKISGNCVKLVKYHKGSYFGEHTDFKIYEYGSIYKTLVIQLSNEDEYVGGDLCVKGIIQSKKQGSYSLFLSSDVHEVKIIEEGVRFSLTIFLIEDDFQFSKSII
jgi:hypothetical protein